MKLSTRLSMKSGLFLMALTGSALLSGCDAVQESKAPLEASKEVLSSSQTGLEKYFKYDSFTLDNGLRVLVHTDRKTPSVSVNTFIHVGSKDEPKGRSGFAHLFEHLLFKGTERNPGEFFKYLEDVGAIGMNAFTSNDVTGYFETVPTGALEYTLWLEADRMMNTIDSLTEDDLKVEVDIVKNEKGGRDNQPFGDAGYDSTKMLYPASHPYAHSVIGSIEDLEAATLDDVRAWHEKFYGANNTVMILSGDVDVETAKTLVKKHFSNFPSGEAFTKQTVNTVRRTQNTTQESRDIASSSQIVRNYIIPRIDTLEGLRAATAVEILGSGNTSRLKRDLVDEQKLATYAIVGVRHRELDSMVVIYVEPREGVSLDQLSKSLDENIETFLKDGPTNEEIERYRDFNRTQITDLATSPSGKGFSLIEGFMLFDDPHMMLNNLSKLQNMQADEIQLAAQKWFSQGYHEERHIAEPARDESQNGKITDTSPEVLPTDVQKVFYPDTFALKNGLEVVFLPRTNAPNITFALYKGAGLSDMVRDDKVKMGMVQELLNKAGAPGLTKEEFTDFKHRYVSSLFLGANPSATRAMLSVDPEHFEKALPVWAGLVKTPHWSQKDWDDILELEFDALEKEKSEMASIAKRIFNKHFLGEENTFSNQEEKDLLKTININQLKSFAESWFTPDGFKLYVAGDIDRDSLEAQLNKHFGDWEAVAEPQKPLKAEYPAARARPLFVLIDEKDVTQTYIYAARRLQHSPTESTEVKDVMNAVFGRGFTSRINLNLREDKGWTYGASSRVSFGSTQTVWSFQSTVDAEHTVDSIRESTREIEDILSTNPISKAELEDVINQKVLGYASSLTDNYTLIRKMIEGLRYGGDYGYNNDHTERLKAVTLQDVRNATPEVLNPNDLAWVIQGDLSKFEDELRAANLGEVIVHDQKGNRIR